MTVLVVGYGNPLRSDDGVGPVVADLLAADPRLAGAVVRSGHQLTPELAYDAAGARLLVLIDAADGPPAGEIGIRRIGSASGGDGGSEETAPAGLPVGAGGPSLTHHLDPDGLLGLARALFGSAPSAVVVSIGAGSFEVGETLTPEVAAAVPRAVEVVAALVGEDAHA
ncbi:MAG: hydrogenase maturation protease [Chloroflexota bacterium]